MLIDLRFQSTHLSRGATCLSFFGLCKVFLNFNPHTSHEVRQYIDYKIYQFPNISIHTPLTRCDKTVIIFAVFRDISIHTPLTRCDFLKLLRKTNQIIFQSTHLSRGATINPRRYNRDISKFQSTHLSRGATDIIEIIYCIK